MPEAYCMTLIRNGASSQAEERTKTAITIMVPANTTLTRCAARFVLEGSEPSQFYCSSIKKIVGDEEERIVGLCTISIVYESWLTTPTFVMTLMRFRVVNEAEEQPGTDIDALAFNDAKVPWPIL